ncbi:MAG: phage integrase N-terminal SAM-like domain-containing protein [Candidatus Marinimicrobia bacterium]|nr:phage integrase N-terminal SAM-like domain-containing protein [Candidatus Neomarinimicrobiota bacterium]
MRKAELLKTAEQKLTIRNYSPRTIKSYLSSIKHFSYWHIRNEVKSGREDLLEKY